jgi:NADP-dependent 3-hydroxy acid dehydrogenase YdfG
MSELQGRVVAVTGASKGIGADIAIKLASLGVVVLAGARNIAGCAHAGITYVELDVTDEASVQNFAAKAAELHVDTLINNAGVGCFGPSEGISVADYRMVMDTNVLGTILVTKAFIPLFKAAGKGQLLNITSDVSTRTFGGGALYCASKHAQRALTQSVAMEGKAFGLRVTEIRPGMTDTYFAESQQGAAHKSEWLRVSDVTSAVVYVLSAPAHVRIDDILVHPVCQEVAF